MVEKMKEQNLQMYCPTCREPLQEGDIFCTYCGTKIYDESRPASGIPSAHVGAPSKVPVSQYPYHEPATPPANQWDMYYSQQMRPKDANKALRKHSRSIKLTRLMKIAAFALTVIIVLTGLVIGGVMAGSSFKSFDVSSANDTFTSSDGKLSVSIDYDKEAFRFENNSTAELRLTLENVTPTLLRDVSVRFNLPDGLRLTDQENVLRTDFLAPNGSRTFRIPVAKADTLKNNFIKIVLVLLITALSAVALIIAYAMCSKKYKRLVKPIVAVILSIAILLPSLGSTVFAAYPGISNAELIIDEERGLASGIKFNVTSENSLVIGNGANSAFVYQAEYSTEERLMLEFKARESETLVDISWNAIAGTQEYCLYQAGEDKNFVEIATTEEKQLEAEIYPNYVHYFRVMAKTGHGDVYSNDVLVLMNDEGRVYADSDGDLLPDELEAGLGTSPLLVDTDGDGISDFDEITITMTDPLVYDSDDNGVGDGDEDPDGDGLTNLFEIEHKTSPLKADTDDDGLDDGFEMNEFLSDPLKYDTDGDGLSDKYEYMFGADPNVADSDGDGVVDSQASYTAAIECDKNSAVFLNLTDIGDSLTAAQVTEITETVVFADKEYVVSPIVSVEVAETTTGTITLPLLKEASSPEDVAIVVYDLEANGFRVLTDSQLSEDGLQVSASLSEDVYRGDTKRTDQGSEISTKRAYYVAFFVPNWHTEFKAPLSPGREEGFKAHFDVGFVIDESSSMEDASKGPANDPDRLRVVAAKNFTKGLIAGDRAAVVGFNDQARRKNNLTEDMDEVRAAIDAIVGTAGGTALYNGLLEAIEELIKIRDETRGRFIIALTDGEDNNSAEETYDNIIKQCVEHHIPLYTIGLGSSVNTELLAKLANFTGGSYFHIRSAEDIPQVFNRIENTAFFGEDTDGDGLADKVEEFGMRDGLGDIYKTDPLNRFTDGDDLNDGEEAGNVMYSEEDEEGNTIAYYIMLTNPTKADTDGDGLDDLDELLAGTLPWCSDTDGDGLSDGFELSIGYNPLSANADGDSFSDKEEYEKNLQHDLHLDVLTNHAPESADVFLIRGIFAAMAKHDPFAYDLNFADKSVSLVQGLILGDFDDILVELGLIDEKLAGSFFYTLGSSVSTLLPVAGLVASARDFFANLIKGDWPAASFSAVSLIPAAGKAAATVKAIQNVCGLLEKAYNGYVYLNELSEEKSVSQLLAMPAFSIYLLKVITFIDSTLHIDVNYDSLMNLFSTQIDRGVKGLEKDNIRNWEAILLNTELTPHRVSDFVRASQTIVLDVPYKSEPIALANSVRTALNNQAGGILTTDHPDGLYTLVRTFDLESTAYQDEEVLNNALEDGVDRMASYVDKSYPSLHKKLQIAISDAIVSKETQSVFQSIQDYADESGVEIEYCLYLTSDDRDPRADIVKVEASDKKEAIIILPGITGSELVAAEDWGAGVSSVKEGDILWLPKPVSELFGTYRDLRKQGVQAFFQEDYSDTDTTILPSSAHVFPGLALAPALPDLQESLDRLVLDSSGRAPFKIRARQVEPQDSYVGTFGSTTKLYHTCMEKYGDTHDVVFFGYDWRKSVSETAAQLKMFIDLREYEKMTFVCHSMGGIVASYYLAENESDIEKVERVITMGTPFGGSPKALLTLEEGKFLDIRIALLDALMKELSRNYPSVYELLPYNQLIENAGTYVTKISSDNVCERLDTAETEQYITNKGSKLNQKMYRDALDVQNKIYQSGEHILNDERIDAYIIAGYGVETLMTIETDGKTITGTWKNTLGDGTVPLTSALRTNGQYFNKTLYFAKKVKHSELPEDNDVIDLVCQIIERGQSAVPGGNTFEIHADAEKTIEELIPDESEMKKSKNTVSAFCPVALALVNGKDEILGLVSSYGIVADEAYEAYFELLDGGETKQIDIPPGCSVKVIGESEGKMDLVMSSFSPDGDLLERSYFRDIDVTEQMQAKVVMTDAADVIIEIDSDGDNVYEQTLTQKDSELFVKDVEAEESGGDYRLWILIGLAGLIVLGTVLSLLIISMKYSTKKRWS